jgi:5-hydroxyisourate hydrolase
VTVGLSTHVLDTARGRPAAGLVVTLARRGTDGWEEVATAVTDDDGRVASLVDPGDLHAGTWRLTFATGDYHRALDVEAFHPHVSVAFAVTAPEEHHHVPLLLSPFGYTTYRGS